MHKTIFFSIFALLTVCQTSNAQSKPTSANHNKHVFTVGKLLYTGGWVIKDQDKKQILSTQPFSPLKTQKITIEGKGVKVTKIQLDQGLGVRNGYRLSETFSGTEFPIHKGFNPKHPLYITILKAVDTKTGKEVDFRFHYIILKIAKK